MVSLKDAHTQARRHYRQRRFDKSSLIRYILTMAEIDTEIKAYEKMQPELEAHHMGKWVLLHDGKLVNVYDTFELATEDAVRKFGRGPFLIRQVGAPPVTLPASVMYCVGHA
jgi:hypothetical protein